MIEYYNPVISNMKELEEVINFVKSFTKFYAIHTSVYRKIILVGVAGNSISEYVARTYDINYATSAEMRAKASEIFSGSADVQELVDLIGVSNEDFKWYAETHNSSYGYSRSVYRFDLKKINQTVDKMHNRVLKQYSYYDRVKMYMDSFTEVLKRTTSASPKIDIRRAPETSGKAFDFITVEFPLYASYTTATDNNGNEIEVKEDINKWISENKKLLANYAVKNIADSSKFKKYGIPVNCLKLYSIKKVSEDIFFYFSLKDIAPMR